MYTKQHSIPDYKRLIFTRLRLSSHNLKIEPGRWHVPPIPRDQRLCSCGPYVQDEEHMIELCTITQSVRLNNAAIAFSKINILNNLDIYQACSIYYNLYSLYNL